MKRSTFYFFLLFICLTGLYGQNTSPGGINGAKLWFKTAPVSSNLNGLYKWQDFSKDSTLLLRYDTLGAGQGLEYTLARNKIRTYNFNPAIDLSSAYKSKEILIKNSNLSQATIIAVWGPDSIDFNTAKFLFALNGRKSESIQFTKNKVIQSIESGKSVMNYGNEEGKNLQYQPNETEISVSKYHERFLRIGTYYKANKPNTSIWGEQQKAVISLGFTFLKTNINNTSTFDDKLLNNKEYLGYTPEFIVYNRLLTPLERRNVETYLAIKYGLSLDMSYITGGGQLLWDLSENQGYNNRITGYGRDDLSGMYQRNATTSYEEAPYNIDNNNNAYDSYDSNNSYNNSSRYRLLVVGRQQANLINDGDYVIFGDNDSTIATSNKEGVGGMKRMSRQWLVHTNKLPTEESDKVLNWNVQGLDMYTYKFKSTITKQGSSTLTNASAITTTPLNGSDGYLAWTVGTRRGPIIVKFGTNNSTLTANSNDYGYYFASNGSVYTVIKGVQTTTKITSVTSGKRIEIEKDGNLISLRIDGVRNPDHEIVIDSADTKKSYYGSILITKDNSYDIVMTDLRHGGFVDTGNRLELSYIAQRASEFENYRNGKSYLIIDRTGTGNFDSDSVEYYPTDELDEGRYKMIFNNIFWDKDGNGKDMFTFGYKMSNVLTVIRKTDPGCTGNTPLENGSIHMLIKDGLKGFNYQLAKNSVITNSGVLYDDTLQINNLAQGDYTLALTEIGGLNFSNKQTGTWTTQAMSSSYFNVQTNAYMEWAISGSNTHASVAFMTNSTISSNANSIVFDYGVVIDGINLYAIVKGIKDSSPFATVSTGNSIRIERNNNKIIYYVNGTQIILRDIISTDATRYFYGVSRIETDASGIYNLKTNGLLSSTTWSATDNMNIQNSNGDVISYDLTLTPTCMEKAPSEPKSTDGESHISVYYKDSRDLSQITVKLELEQPSPSNLLMFDVSGKLIYKVDLPASNHVQTTDIKLPETGVYVIKAITNEGEYSKKVISKNLF